MADDFERVLVDRVHVVGHAWSTLSLLQMIFQSRVNVKVGQRRYLVVVNDVCASLRSVSQGTVVIGARILRLLCVAATSGTYFF